MRRGIARVERDRPVEHLARRERVRLGGAAVQIAAPEAQIVGVEARRRPSPDLAHPLVVQLAGEARGDAVRQFLLHREQVVERPVEALGPEMHAAAHLLEPRSHSDAPARTSHRAADEVAGGGGGGALFRLLGPDGQRCSGKVRSAARGDDMEALEAGQVGDEVGGQSGGEVALLGRAADVLEGQHDDHGPAAERGRRRRRRRGEGGRAGSGAHLGGEAVAATRDGGDEPRRIRAERPAQGRNLHLQVVLLDDGARPDSVQQRILGDQFAPRLDQREQHVEGAAPERDGLPVDQKSPRLRQQAPPPERVPVASCRRSHPEAPIQEFSAGKPRLPRTFRTQGQHRRGDPMRSPRPC